MTAVFSVDAPAAGDAAIAVVHLSGDLACDIDHALSALGAGAVAPGQVCLRSLAQVDRGVIARVSEHHALIMPHAGVCVLETVLSALARAGVAQAGVIDPRQRYPEAESLIEARMLEALSRAASARATGLLLDQPRRWARAHAASDPALDRVRMRLIDPPLIVAAGCANVGKSTLMNALARRRVALTADEPGTTRDHVGVMLDLGGICVQYVDTPGIRVGADEHEQAALTIALAVIARADLILLLGDHQTSPDAALDLEPRLARAVQGRAVQGRVILRVALKADQGVPAWTHDLAVAAQQGQGLDALAAVLRERLVPQAALDDPSPWRFWGDPSVS
jgi:tRNA U34 5-carboxymethylaminomethyl modifying GTPase MnmE/TrmE